MATKKAGTTPAKKSATPVSKAAETASPKPAAKKAAAKTSAEKAPAKTATGASAAEKLPGKTKPPTHAEIAALAHRYWEQRGRPHGGHNDDWLRAEKELKG